LIRVLVVDDSAFIRKALARMLESDPEIRVVGSARDGIDALEQVAKLDPDLVTLDVDMPRLDGLGALRRIMAECPRPVVMVSSLTERGAEVTLQALDLGALDYIPKGLDGSLLDIGHIGASLCAKVKVLGRRRPLTHATPRPPRAAVAPRPKHGPRRYLAIGASTGGPPALQKIFSGFSRRFLAPVVVVQHMPKAFTGSFARRLDAAGPLCVKEAETGDRLEPGKGFVAPGGSHLVVRKEGPNLTLFVTEKPAESLHKPSVDVTFRSFAEAVGHSTLAVVLTGMGSDGLEGVKSLKAAGGHALAQEAGSCVVYGMPRAIVEAGMADEVLPIEEMVKTIEGLMEWTQRPS